MMAPQQVAGLAALRRIATQAQERATAAAARTQAKRGARRARVAAEAPPPEPVALPPGVTRVPNFGSAAPPPAEPAVLRPATAGLVREWFRTGIRKLYPDLVLPPDGQWWTIVEMSLARKLLDQYGPELVERAVVWGCAHWPAFLARTANDAKPLLGYPSIRWLWGWREPVFLAIQDAAAAKRLIVGPKAGKRGRRDQDEWAGAAPSGHGWGVLDEPKKSGDA